MPGTQGQITNLCFKIRVDPDLVLPLPLDLAVGKWQSQQAGHLYIQPRYCCGVQDLSSVEFRTRDARLSEAGSGVTTLQQWRKPSSLPMSSPNPQSGGDDIRCYHLGS